MSNFALISFGRASEWALSRERIAEIMAASIEPQIEMPEGEDGAMAEPGPVDVCLPASLEGLDLTEYGIATVRPTGPPALLPGQTAVEAEPVMIEGEWTQQWTTQGDLPAGKLAVRAAITARREIAVTSNCATPKGVVQADRQSSQNIQAAVTLAQIALASGQPYSQMWIMADDSLVEHDATEMIAMGVAVGVRASACYAQSFALKGAVEAAEDFDALAAIDIEADWP